MTRTAILGGGILGVCTALELARRGREVTLYEGAEDVLQGASRWSEGKIHLGFLYSADPTLRTATRLIPGGLAFAGLVSRLLDRELDPFVTTDELFLIHRRSIVDAAAFKAYADRTADLVRDAASRARAPRYLIDATRAATHELSRAELSAITVSDDVVAGYRVPERSVSTVAIADLLRQALLDEPRVEVHTKAWVTAVTRRDDHRLDVVTRAGTALPDIGPFDVIVNALWEGRPAVDATLGIRPPAPWSHRFRAALFARASTAELPNAVVSTGPFGDMKRYADGRVYLSWYDAGLLAEGHDVEPPRSAAMLTPARCEQIRQGTIDSLAKIFPAVHQLRAEDIQVRGGWVYAIGQGALADRDSTLHRRDQFDMTVDGGYISVDTAKYSLAPWLAARAAGIVTQE